MKNLSTKISLQVPVFVRSGRFMRTGDKPGGFLFWKEVPEQELLAHLSVLKDSELLYERGIYPESTYIFKHALSQEVVYNSILTKGKKRLHEEIGNAIEQLYKENIEEHYEELVGHFIYSEKYEKGAEYSRLAGKKAEKSAALNDAISYVKKRIACLEKLSVTDEVQKKIIDARTALGLYISQLNHPVEAKEAIDPIIDLAIKNDYRRRLSQIYTIIGVYNLYVEEELPEAEDWIKKAIRAHKSNGMKWHLGRDYALYADLLKRKGNQSKAKEKLAKALEIFTECGADGWVEKYEKELATLS